MPGATWARIDLDKGSLSTGFQYSLLNANPLGGWGGWDYIQTHYIGQSVNGFSITFTALSADMKLVVEGDGNNPSEINSSFYIDNFVLEEIKPQPETPPVVSNGCITLTQSKWVTQWVDSCYYVSKWPWPYYGPIVNGYAQVNDHAIEVVAPADEDGISFAIEVVPGVQQQLLLEASGVSGSVSVYLA